MRLAFLVLGMLASSVLVGCHTCSHCDGSFVGDDGLTYKPVKPSPIAKVLEKKSCSCKKHKDSKHKHKGNEHCPFCMSEGEMAFDGMSFGGSTGCAGCGAPASMGPMGCSSCGMPSSPYAITSGCSSCAGMPGESFPTSGCSSCQGGIPYSTPIQPDCPSCRNNGGTPTPFNAAPPMPFPMNPMPAESVPSFQSPTPAPAPPAEEKPLSPMATPSASLIPILPPPSGPRHVHWVPTPVK